jgi:lysine-N-methylase
MQIDPETLKNYKNNQTDYSSALKRGVNFKKSKFKTDKNRRCAFLNKDGLCEIISNLGEQSLCQVCRDHPRFRSFFDGVIETGLGFCCEEATRIILSTKSKIEKVLVSDDKHENETCFIEQNILEFREKVLDIIQDRNININQRLQNLILFCHSSFCLKDFGKVVKLFLSFERLNKTWSNRLKSLRKTQLTLLTDESLSVYCEHFLVNSFYRHLYTAEDTISARAITLAIIVCWWVVKSIYDSEKSVDDFSLVCDVVRSFSCEVEYSNENLNRLFAYFEKYIKI